MSHIRNPDERLAEVSTGQWGTPVHGRFAAEYLGQFRRFVALGAVVRVRDTRGIFVEFPGQPTPGFSSLCDLPSRDEVIVDTEPNSPLTRDMEDEVLRKLEASSVPFEMRLAPGSSAGFAGSRVEHLGHVVPMSLDGSRLWNYVTSRNLARHALHGSTGKMLDTICGLAGMSTADREAREWDGDFMDKAELANLMVSQLPYSDRRRLMGIVNGVHNEQVWTGAARVGVAEMIIEGSCQLSHTGKFSRWESVAVGSLVSLATNSSHETTLRPSHLDFLKNLRRLREAGS